ncbi:MAG: hypothetical protein ACHQ5A_03800 [Opitutales bacterium]
MRFRNVMAADGGPVERVEMAEISMVGRRCFQANAYLREDLKLRHAPHVVYGSANGTGADESPMVARFKAVSEALERWAYMTVQQSGSRHDYGFEVDPSSNGMAAFPGLWRRQARTAALLEAAERFNLLSWWEGRLEAMETATPWPGVRAAVLCSEVPGITVIVHRQSAFGFYVYGHAAGPDFGSACWRAAMEMERHDRVVHRYRSTAPVGADGPGSRSPAGGTPPVEQRCLFFSSPEGHELFLDRLRTPSPQAAARPRLVFDGAIPGPWNRYADVWRVAYEPPSDRFLGGDPQYFFW